MRYLSAAIAALSLLAVSPALAADDDAPSFDKGPVWDFGQVQTKDGHFDDYMKWLSTHWKAQQEALKKAGYIISYKVLVVADPRQGEPDIILATEYATQKKIFGPLVVASQQQAARGSIRTILGDVIMREAILK
jgi:hypothetical protein